MPTARPLTADEWETWRDLRLRALADAPDAFMSTSADEAARPDAFWRDLVAATAAHDRGELWIAEADGLPVGMGFSRLDPDGDALHLFAMWVSPDARRTGTARSILEAMLAWGVAAEADRADLWVTAGNEAAERLYAGLGFVSTGDRSRLREGSDRFVVRLERPL